jgi:hypothetical protein
MTTPSMPHRQVSADAGSGFMLQTPRLDYRISLAHNLDITGGSAMKKPRGGDGDDELSLRRS